jgi:hypothetical protein
MLIVRSYAEARYNYDEWQLTDVGIYTHVRPKGDIIPHTVSLLCSCQPVLDGETKTVVMHNSYDEREYKHIAQ